MSSRRHYFATLDASDWVLLGYIAGVLVYYLVDVMAEPTSREESSRAWTEQTVTLTEDHLQRLEDGRSLKISRWHGVDLVIDGGMVVDADDLEEQDDRER